MPQSYNLFIFTEVEECGPTTIISVEKSQGVKEQAQKRVQEWVNQPTLESTHLPPLEDPSIILTSPEFPQKKSDKSKHGILGVESTSTFWRIFESLKHVNVSNIVGDLLFLRKGLGNVFPTVIE